MAVSPLSSDCPTSFHFHAVLISRKLLCAATLQGSPSFKVKNLHNLELFCTRDLSLFPTFVNFFNHLDQKQLMNIYILGYDLMLVYFVAQLISTLVTGSFCIWLPGLFDTPHDCGSFFFLFFFFLRTTYSLPLQDARVLLVYLLLHHFSKEPCSFYWRMALAIRVWVLDVLVATSVSFLLGLLS